MATTKLCDCCGVQCDSCIMVGHFDKVEYCEKCAAAYATFEEDRNVLHSSIAEKWEKDLEKLKVRLRKEHPKMLFPDA